MARLLNSGFETNSVTATIEVDSFTGAASASVVTSPVHSGTYALQFTGSIQSFARYNFYAANTAAVIYVRAYLYISSSPLAQTSIIQILDSTNAICASLALTTTNTLKTLNTSGTAVGTTSSALTTGAWHCVELSVDTTVSSGTIIGRLDGGQFSSAAGNATATAQRIRVGSTAATATTLIFDDIAINDGTGGSQNSWPGIANMVRVTPNAAGDSNTFLTTNGGTAGATNNFTRINEITPDGLTTYNASAIAASDLFAVAASGIPAGSTINCVMVGGDSANITSGDATTSFQYQIEKTSAGTISKSADIVPNTITMQVNQKQPGGSTYPLTLYNDPDGNPWTTTTIGTMQIGYLIHVTNVRAIGVSTVWAMVDYTTHSSNTGLFAFF